MRTVGVLLDRSDTRLRFLPLHSGQAITIPMDSIRLLEVRLPRQSNADRGARIGAVTGAGLTAALVIAALAVQESDSPDLIGPAAVAGLVLVGGGALMGAGVGAVIRTPRWTRVTP